MTAVETLLLDSPAAMPCLHRRVQHQHGTRAAYQHDRCRCAPCKEAKNAYERRRNRQIAYGRWNAWVDAAPARQRVLEHVKATGDDWRATARTAGLAVDTVERLLFGVPKRGIPQSRRIRRGTADKLVQVVGLWEDQPSDPKSQHGRIADGELVNGSIQRDAGVRVLVAPVERPVSPSRIHGAGQHGQ